MATVAEKDEMILKRKTLAERLNASKSERKFYAPLFVAELEELPNLKKQTMLHIRDC